MEAKAKAERKSFRIGLKDWVKTHCPNWTDEPVVKNWFEKIPAKRSRLNIKSDFELFIGFMKMCPTAMMERRKSDQKSDDTDKEFYFEDRAIAFKNELAKHHYGKSTIHTIIARIQSFFAHSRRPLKFARGDLSVKVTDAGRSTKRRKRFVKRTSAEINIDIRQMYNIAGPEDRVILMFLYQYGLAPIDVSHLRIDQIPIDESTEEDFIYWEATRSKTGELVQTALNPEIIHDYKAMMINREAQTLALISRGTIKEDPQWVFITNRGNRLREDHISDRIKDLADRALDAKRAADFLTKDLRDCFNIALTEVNPKIPQEIKDRLYGHKPKGARGAYEVSPKGIIETYQKVFGLVSLDGWKQKSRSNREREEVFELMAEFMLKTNSEFVEAFEKLKGMEPGGVARMLEERMTGQQIISVPSKRH